MLRRVVKSVVGLYLLFAVIGRFVEGMGAVRLRCQLLVQAPNPEHVPVGLSLEAPPTWRLSCPIRLGLFPAI
jgi:hypothetical protein